LNRAGLITLIENGQEKAQAKKLELAQQKPDARTVRSRCFADGGKKT
jgi:hypothetical protein